MNEYTINLPQSSSQLVTKYTGGLNFLHLSHIMLILDQLTWHIALGFMVITNYRIYVRVTQKCVTQVNNHEVLRDAQHEAAGSLYLRFPRLSHSLICAQFIQ